MANYVVTSVIESMFLSACMDNEDVSQLMNLPLMVEHLSKYFVLSNQSYDFRFHS